jgi:ATP-dependent exoDNAse (exonuclease V) beta subunit
MLLKQASPRHLISSPQSHGLPDSTPKGIQFYKWLANNGWDESQAIKQAAGDKGSKVHAAVEDLIDGQTVAMEAKYLNHSTEQDEPLSLEEYECLMSFGQWVKDSQPQFLKRETVVWNAAEGYAGTVDCVAKIGEDTYIIDFKTGQNVWPEYELQVSAYKHADHEYQDAKLAILQLGYRRNGKGYKFTDIEDKYALFLAAKQIWSNETTGEKPLQKDYPLALSLTPEAPADEVKKPKKAKANENV